ncbi:MAG: hypothetical protein WD052_05400 [Bacteroidales bacterium]
MSKLSAEMEIEPNLALPLAYGSFSLLDVLESLDSTGFVEQTEDGLLYIYYTDTAYSVNAAELITLPNKFATEIYIQSDVEIPIWLALGEGEVYTFTKTDMMDFVIDPGDQIDSLYLREGDLNINVFSEFKHAGELTISSSQIIDPNGDTLNEKFVISEVDGSYTAVENYDMTGYKLDIDQVDSVASVRINFALELTKSSAGIGVDEECGITIDFENMVFSHIFGQISEREVINVSQSMDIGFYDAVSEILNVYFKDPQFNFTVENSYGVPVNLNLSNVRARSSQDGLFYDLTFEPGIMPFNVLAPEIDQLGETVTTTLFINNETSNIGEIISRAPDMINFEVIAGTGDGSGTGQQNFVLDTSKLIVKAELVLPMWLRTDGYTLQDTMDMDLEGMLGNLSFVKDASIRLTTLNEWPLGVDMQVYFMDADYNVLDTLFKEENIFLLAAPVDMNGELDNSQLVENINEVAYSGDELLNLDGTKYVKIKAHATTTNNGEEFVKFFSHYLLNYRMSIDAQFHLNPSELSGGEQQ